MNENDNETLTIKEKLLPWLAEKMPHAENILITECEKPGMGLSSETYMLNVEWKEKGEKKSKGMVLRLAPQEYKVFPNYELNNQFRIMQILEQTNVPVAKMLWMEDDTSLLGSQFFLMEKLTGEVPQDYPSYHGSGMFFDASPEQRAKMWWSTLDAMTEIHKLDWKKLGISFLKEPENNADAIEIQLEYWSRYFEWMKQSPDESHPIIDASLQWLKENRYEPEHLSLCWGDARMGNILFSIPDKNILAVMDWEMAFIGDPEADLAWSILLDWQHSIGAGLPRCDGTPGYDETISRYEEKTDRKVTHFKFNEIFAAVRYGMILVAVFKKFRQQGIPIDEDMVLNNVCTQRLSELLDLPSPGKKKEQTEDLSLTKVSVQFHFTGSDGYDWYLISDKGKGTRTNGIIDNPDCTITASLTDWKAIQNGELDKLDAWTSGQLVTEGDLNVMVQLEEMISEFTKNDM